MGEVPLTKPSQFSLEARYQIAHNHFTVALLLGDDAAMARALREIDVLCGRIRRDIAAQASHRDSGMFIKMDLTAAS